MTYNQPVYSVEIWTASTAQIFRLAQTRCTETQWISVYITYITHTKYLYNAYNNI